MKEGSMVDMDDLQIAGTWKPCARRIQYDLEAFRLDLI
jgi:hypothetical protein